MTLEGGWVILYDKNGWSSNKIPLGASGILKQLSSKGVELKQIAFSPEGGSLILYGKNELWSEKVP